MKLAILMAEAAASASGLSWTWHCDEDQAKSARVFEYYYDCVVDAQRHGYLVELARAHGASAPAGPHYQLSAREK
jgi:hypothetical protein